MNVGFRDESDGTICGVEGGDNLTRVSIHLDHEAIGRSKVSHGLKVTNPIIKLKRSNVVALILTDTSYLHRQWVGNDGVEELDGDHDDADQPDQEPPDQVVGADDLHQVPLPREPRADQPHVVVAVVIELDVVREPGEAVYQHLGGGGPRPSQVQLVQPRPPSLAVEKEVSAWVKLDSIGETGKN